MLSTEWSRAMGLDAPIVNAPMGGVAGGALAAAVSRAGGLGMVGIGSAGSALQRDQQLRHLSELGRPFGIGLVQWVIASEPQLLTAAIAAEPAMLSVSFGDDFSWVRRAHDGCCATGSPTAGTVTDRSCPPTTMLTTHWQRPLPQTITVWRRSTPDRASRCCEPSVPQLR